MGEDCTAKGPISSIYYIKVNLDLNREIFFPCDPILTAVSEVCILMFKQDHVTLTLYQLFMVRNAILIQNKDFITREVKKMEFNWLLFQPVTTEWSMNNTRKGEQQQELGKRQTYHQS